MDIANASMYDGASALAEAVIMAWQIRRVPRVLLPETLHPAYRRVVATYCRGLAISLETIPCNQGTISPRDLREQLDGSVAAVVVQQPNFLGCLEACAEISAATHAAGALLIAVVNPLSLGVLRPPGEYDADIAVGDGQCLGVPMSFGGPSVGLFTCRREYARHLPGRIVGATTDQDGKRGFVLTLQTREQHIRRERASSNICTSQQLIALAATVYLSAVGPAGLQKVGELCRRKAHYAWSRITELAGFDAAFAAPFFHEFAVRCPAPVQRINAHLQANGFIGGYDVGRDFPQWKDALLLAVTEKRSRAEIDRLVDLLRRFAVGVG
jgi:glycine dehydrogenase subunit 1